MVGNMNPFVAGRKRFDMKNSTLTNPFQVPNDGPFSILSENNNEIEGAEEMRKGLIQGASSNEKRGHSLLIDGKDLLSVESPIH
jgi:hypothetical protein